MFLAFLLAALIGLVIDFVKTVFALVVVRAADIPVLEHWGFWTMFGLVVLVDVLASRPQVNDA